MFLKEGIERYQWKYQNKSAKSSGKIATSRKCLCCFGLYNQTPYNKIRTQVQKYKFAAKIVWARAILG